MIIASHAFMSPHVSSPSRVPRVDGDALFPTYIRPTASTYLPVQSDSQRGAAIGDRRRCCSGAEKTQARERYGIVIGLSGNCCNPLLLVACCCCCFCCAPTRPSSTNHTVPILDSTIRPINYVFYYLFCVC